MGAFFHFIRILRQILSLARADNLDISRRWCALWGGYDVARAIRDL
jgi:hypothetical protein